MTDLTGKLIANTYKDILTVDTSTTNSGLDNNLRKVQDGAGNSSSLKLSQTAAAFTGNVSVNGNMTVQGTFQPDTINTNELGAVNISATNITTDTLTANNLTFQDVSVSSLRTGNLYAANISAGTISATNINTTNITVDGDGVATSSALASVEAIISSNIVFVLNAQASVLTVLAGLSATDTQLQNNINLVSTTVSAVNVQVGINSNQINTLSTSIAANSSAIAVNSAAITSINSFISAGAFASAGTSATLETRIAAVSSTMATSINNSNTAITNLSATLASTSSTLESHINTVSATLSSTNVALQTSIANSNAAITSLSATMATSIANSNSAITSVNNRVTTLSSTLATSISNSNSAITSVNNRVTTLSSTLATSIANSNSAITALSATMATSINNSNTAIAANTSLITALSTTLESRIATVSSTMATSIASVSSTLNTRIASVSSTMATSIANVRALVTGVNASAIAILQTSVAANSSAIAVLEAATYASANTSATLETRIAAVSSTMATSIANSNSAITSVNNRVTSLSSTLATSISNTNTNVATLSATMATSINNSNAAITSVNSRINSVSVLAETKASAATSANLETRIGIVSALIPTSLTELGIVDGTAGQYLQTNANGTYSFTSVEGGGSGISNITAGTNIALTQNGVTVTETTTSATINVVGVASAGTSASLQSRINTVSATMATSIANHLRLSGGTLTGSLTLNADPTLDLQAATKQYVDNLTASGIHFHESVRVENPGALTVTYNNGTAGVGATLTNAGTQAALVIDGITMVVDDRVLIYEQADATQNGVYVVTNVGSASTNWVLTRSSDTDTSGDGDSNSLDEGSYFFVEEGNTGAGESYICNTPGTITFGTTEITFVQFSSSISYTAGTGININESRVISTSGVATAAQLATLSATMATSIANRTAAITSVNTRINSVSILAETKASAATSANLQTRINAVSVLAETKASAATSANLQTRINTLSATMATSINNSNSAIATLSATMATSINNRTAAITSVNNRVTTLSATMATSIANRTAAITSVNTRINSVSVLAETKASAGTSASLQTRINTLSATMATSINNRTLAITSVNTRINSVSILAETKASAATSANLQTRINTLSATMATSINNRTLAITSVNTRINSVSVLAETKASAATSANLQTRINAVSATMATSIANVSSALGSRITTLSATMATSISNKVSKSGDTMTGDLLMDSANAEINIKSGAAGTTGRLNWTFDTTTTNYASLSLPYDTRATTGFHMDVGYPITIDATTQINFNISGVNKGTLNSSGNLALTGTAHTAGGNTIWHAGNDGAGSGLDADLLDGYSASTTRNAANTIPVRDASGYLQLGWINTTSGVTTSTINKIYASFDDYIRYVTPATLISQLGLWTSSNDGSGSGLDADLLDGVQGANYLRNNATNANATFTDITLDDQIISSGDTDTYMQFHAADQWRVVTGGGERLEVNNSGVNVTGAIVASGNVTAFSDERLKDNIETLDGSKVYEMRGVSYTKDGEASSGVIAQEIQKVAPELVNDSGEYLSVAYGNLVGYLIEGMKQLKQEVVELKAEVEQLKSEK